MGKKGVRPSQQEGVGIFGGKGQKTDIDFRQERGNHIP